MSGTSLDGADGVILTAEHGHLCVKHACHMDMPAPLRRELLSLNASGPDELHRAALAANALAQLYARVVHALLASSGLTAGDVSAIGAHGQTVRHSPASNGQRADMHHPWAAYTLQLNNPALLAELTGISVVADFRSRDVAAGGQGAPLVPAFHQAMFSAPGQNVAVINVGGMANATLLGTSGQVGGFDTGPGNVLMDLWCERHTGQHFDAEGAWAASGQPVPALLRSMQQDAYFERSGPRSTGRDHFNSNWLDHHLAPFMPSNSQIGSHPAHPAPPPEDVQATLCALTAWSIVRSLPADLDTVVVCGGGTFNTTLMADLAQRLSPVRVLTSDALGLPSMQVEAAAFAWLAMQTMHTKPGNVQAVTGAAAPRILGAVYPA